MVASPPPSPKSTSNDWKTLGDKFSANPRNFLSVPTPDGRQVDFYWGCLSRGPRTSIHSASLVITMSIPSAMYSRHHHRAIHFVSCGKLTLKELIFLFYQNFSVTGIKQKLEIKSDLNDIVYHCLTIHVTRE